MKGNDSDLTGGWCWFQERRVVTTRNSTLIGWTEYDARGTISIARFDHGTKEFEINRGVGGTPAAAPDDHNAPAVYVRQDGRVMVFYTAHNRPDGNRYRISDEPPSIDSFGDERSIEDGNESTYPMPFWVNEPGELFYFYRDKPEEGGPSTFYYYRSPDEGETWSPRRRLFELEGDDYSGYVKVDVGDDRMDFCFSRHPRSAPLPRCDVRHFYYDGADDQFKDSHGDPIRTPVRERATTRLFDAQATGERGWIWDVQTVDDNPAIVFASFTDGDEREQRYYYSKYTGSEWTVAEIVETDHLYATYRNGRANEREYAPGICLGHEQGDDVVYLSRNTGPRDDRKSGLQIEKWRVGDTHETSQPERVIERGDENNQFRPVAPRSVRNQTFCSPVRVVWMCCQSKAPYNYSDEEETVKLKAEIGTTEGTETVRMDNWKDYHDRR